MKSFPQILEKEKYLGMSPLEQEKYVERKIREILHDSQNGITVSDITENSPFTRPTVIKHLERLVSCREGYKVKRGNVFIYYPNGKAAYPEKQIKVEIGKGRVFKGTFLENNYGKFVFIEIEGADDISGGGFLVKREDFQLFSEFIHKISKEA